MSAAQAVVVIVPAFSGLDAPHWGGIARSAAGWLVSPVIAGAIGAALLALLAFPLVVGVTRWTQRHPPALSAGTLRGIVAGLLVLAGSSLLLGSLA